MIHQGPTLRTAYDEVGTGVPLLLIHGFPHSRSLWAPQTGALVEHCRCIAPDLRGFGESSLDGPYSMDRYADDLAELLDGLGVRRAVVAGLSMGGYIAFAMWRRHPHLIRALILADTRAGADSQDAIRRRFELIALAKEIGSSAVADAQITGMVGATTRAQNPALVSSLHQMLASAPVEGIVGALQAMMDRPDSTSTLATINVPTLVMVGEEDVLTPVREARIIHGGISGSRMATIPSAGHVSNLERPAAFNHALSEFIGSLNYA